MIKFETKYNKPKQLFSHKVFPQRKKSKKSIIIIIGHIHTVNKLILYITTWIYTHIRFAILITLYSHIYERMEYQSVYVYVLS